MLREPVANQWSDGELNQFLQDADTETFEKMSRIRNSGYGQIQEEITLAANASEWSLAPGTPPAALTYNAEAISFIEHQTVGGFWNLCQELQEGDEFRYRAQNAIVATADVPPLYRVRRPNIIFLPIASAARTLRVTYRPLPRTLSEDGDYLNVPDKRVLMVCTRAAYFALAQLGEQENQFDAAYGVLEDEMYRDLEHPNAEGRALEVKKVDTPALFNF